MNKDEVINGLLNMKDGESFTIPDFPHDMAQIWFKNGTYFLFELQPCIGEEHVPVYDSSYEKHNLYALISIVNDWT